MQPFAKTAVASRALLSLGANLSILGRHPKDTIAKALDLLAERTGTQPTASRFYRTPAFPPGAGPDFVNAAAELPWSGTAQDLLSLLHEIEASLGRTRKTRWEARIMDMDLIALGDQVLPDVMTQRRWADLPTERAAIETPDQVILPHPRLQERGFVLVPLAEIAPNWRHPLTGESVAEMLAARPASERAEIWPIP